MEQVRHYFQLQPFVSNSESENLQISGSLTRCPGAILIDYRIIGNLDSINWPAPIPSPDRCHDLWQNTCFELFVSPKGKPCYWEVNVSPNGCWNVYRFAAYREKMLEELSIYALCYPGSQNDCGWDMSFRLETNGVIEDDCALEIGISTVLQHCLGDVQHWALCHPRLKADFHDRSSFTMKMPAVAG